MERDLLSFENKAVLVWPEGPEEKSAYWIPEDIFSWSGNFIRSQLQFKKDYQRFVDKLLRNIAKSDKSGKEVLFVGMHARRTDYIAFSKKVLKTKIAGKSHFLEGMEYFQEEFPDNELYFMAVSDDMQWMRKHLGHIDNVVMAGIYS